MSNVVIGENGVANEDAPNSKNADEIIAHDEISNLTTRLNEEDFDPSIFEPLPTNWSVLNDFLSNKGGVMPATATMVTGSPGAGKTTLLFEMASQIQQNGGRALCISIEMNEIDVASYMERFPQWGELDIYFPDFDRDIYHDVKKLLKTGFDFVVIDSFKELKDIVADERGWTKTKTERELLNLMEDCMRAENQTNTHSAFYVVQQVLKSGDFAGSKRLEHMMTANLKMTVEGNDSYLYFEKNRRGDAHRKLFYQIKNDGIAFDAERRKNEEEAIEFTEKEKERRQQQQKDFDDIGDLLNDGGGSDQMPTPAPWLNGEYERMDEELREIVKQLDEPVTDKENVPTDIFEQVWEYEDGNLSATIETLDRIGAAPELTYYYGNKIAEEIGLK